MVFVYIRIYYAAKARARRGIRKTQQHQKNSRQQDHHHSPRQAAPDKQVTSFSTSPARAGAAGAGSNGGGPGAGGSGGGPGGGPGCIQTSVTVETPPVIPNITCDFASDISTSDNAEQSQDASGPYLEAPKDTLKVVGAGGTVRPSLLTPTPAAPAAALQHRGSVMSVNGELAQQAAAMQRMRQPSVGIDTDMVSEFDPSSSDSGVVSRCAVVKPLKLRLCQPIFGRRTTSKTKREIIDMGRMPGGQQAVVEVVQSPRPSKRDPEREKRRLARKKEKRATLILGLIMGSFIACWLPFFTLYILTPLCSFCNIPDKAFAIAFWLGYMNSVLNPVIYTVFNKDFRRAFRRILFK